MIDLRRLCRWEEDEDQALWVEMGLWDLEWTGIDSIDAFLVLCLVVSERENLPRGSSNTIHEMRRFT